MTSRSDSRLTDRRRDGIAVALLVLLFLVQWARFVFTDRIFYYRDFTFFTAPLFVEVAQQWRTGHFPSWNPRLACGVPLGADPNAAIFFPDSWIVPLFGGWLGGIKLLILARLFLISLGAYLAMRSVGLARDQALLAGAAAGLSGPVATTLSTFPEHLAGAVVILPLAAAAYRMQSGERTPFLATALLFTLSVFSGSPDLAAQGALVVVICGLSRPWLARASRILLALACGALVAAPQLLPAAGLYPRTPRGLGWRLSTSPGFLSFSPSRLVEHLWPRLLGDPGGTGDLDYWGRGLSDGATPYVLSVVVGLVALALLPLSLRHPFGRRLALGFGIFTLISFGAYLPGSRFFLHFPPYSSLRYPEKWQIGAALLLAGAAGVGLGELRRALPGSVARPRAIAWAALGCSAALAAAVRLAPDAVLGAMRALGLLDPTFPPEGQAIVRRAVEREAFIAMAVAALLLAAFALARNARLAHALPAALIAILVLERVPRVFASVPSTTISWFRDQRRIVAPVLGETGDGRFFYDREATNDVDPFRPFTGTLYGLTYAGNTDVDQFSDARARGFAETLQRLGFSDDRKVALLRMADIRVVDTNDPSAATRPELEPFAEGGLGRRFYRLRGSAGARLFFRTATFPAPGQVLGGLLSPEFPIDTVAAVEGGAPQPVSPAPHSVGPVRWFAPDEFEIELETAAPAWLQLAVTFDPNWKLELDGNPAPAAPSDLAFLGLAVPAGRHRLHGKYSDPRFLAGGAIAVATLAGLAVAARRRSAAPTIG